jgi:DNA transformation protein
MAVSPGYLTFVLDQLRPALPHVRGRRMFGGAGVYAGDLCFGVIDDDTLFFKCDDTNRADYESRGMGPFQPMGEGTPTMQYYQLPEEILEDSQELSAWSARAVEVARRARLKKRKGGSGARKTVAKGRGPAKKSAAKRTTAKTAKTARKSTAKKKRSR